MRSSKKCSESKVVESSKGESTTSISGITMPKVNEVPLRLKAYTPYKFKANNNNGSTTTNKDAPDV